MGNEAIYRRIVAVVLLVGQHLFIQQMRQSKPAETITASADISAHETYVAELGPVTQTFGGSPARPSYELLPCIVRAVAPSYFVSIPVKRCARKHAGLSARLSR